jgi:uncharacterized Zn-finger protein
VSVEVAKPKQEFKCTICSKSFSKKSSVADHICLVHGKTPFKCSICNVGFSRKSFLTSHIAQDHQGKKENVDDVFARSVGSILDMETEMHLIPEKSKSHQCTFCGLAFMEYVKLQSHISTDHSESNIDFYQDLENFKKSFTNSKEGKYLMKLNYSVIHISIHPSKELCSKMAPGEVGVSLP